MQDVTFQKKIHNIRLLTRNKGQLVETRKRLLGQIKTRQKQGLGETLEEMDGALHLLLNEQITTLEHQIERLIAADETLAEAARTLRSVLGIGPVGSTMLIAEMPRLGQMPGEQAAALTGPGVDFDFVSIDGEESCF